LTSQDDKNRFIRKLSEDLQEENLALFAGAGLSVAAGFVNWANLLKPIAEDLKLDIEKERVDLVSLAQYHYTAKGNNRSKLNQVLITNFCKDIEVTPNHKILARLPISTYWTTNYDKIIERSLIDAGKIPDIKYTKEHLIKTTPRRDAIVYKMHGDIDHADKAVITRGDYEEYHIERQPFINALTGDITSKTFLFLGFSFTDPNIDYILSRVRIAYDHNQKMHHCILKAIQLDDCEDQADFEYRKRKQEFFVKDLLSYGIESFMIDDYREITEILEGVEKQYRQNTVFISGAAHDYSPKKADESNEFVFNLSKSIIEAGFNIVSGFGLGIGSAVISGALEHIYMKGQTIRSEQLVLRPFPQNSSGVQDLKLLWTEYRNDMLSFSGIAIFVFGNKLKDGDVILSNGMREEFEIAKEKGLFLLPVGATGYMAKELWEEVNENFETLHGAVPKEIKNNFAKLGDESMSFNEMFEVITKILIELKK